MAEKRYAGAPFGTQTARFDVSGIHPQTKIPGTYTEVPYCKRANSAEAVMLGPGTYRVETGDFTGAAMEQKRKGPNWERAFHVATMANIPHILYKEKWEHRRALSQQLGPGTYTIRSFTDEMQNRPSSTRGICQTGESRLEKEDIRNIPGPGTYSVSLPMVKPSPGTQGILENGGKDLSRQPAGGSGLPPGLYHYSSPIQELLDKKVSKKGPYELFSGERQQPSKSLFESAHLGPGKYPFNPFTAELEGYHHKKHGRFSTMPQHTDKPSDRLSISTLGQCPRPPESPGPTHYDNLHRRATSAPIRFTSARRFDGRSTFGSTNPVGPAQYNINRWHLQRHQNGNVNVFTSRTPRLPPKVDSTQERLLQERITPRGMARHHPIVIS
ncbi:hypothetical protein EMCRGX_G019919 [Ephydatia muelleri]